MQVNVGGNSANLGSEACDLVGKHAWRRGLDSVIPVVVVVTQSIGEVQDGHLADVRGVFSDVEVSRLHTALCH